MIFNLWKYLLEDDVDSFRQYLARATFVQGTSKAAVASPASASLKIGSPGQLATSPKTPTRPRKIALNTPQSSVGKSSGPVITRADINARDSLGRTILHHAASSHSEHAAEFVKALLEVPFIDLYVQDSESGWTALHRALYAGNVDISQALLARDILNVTDFSIQSRTQIGGLVKIKDHEGNSPFEVFGSTIAPRDLSILREDRTDRSGDEEANSVDVNEDVPEGDRNGRRLQPRIDLHGDEAFAFGSNKNLSLGLGDEDDRQFPGHIHLERPEHLLWRLYQDHKVQRQHESSTGELVNAIADLHQSGELPAIIRHKAIKIQDIVMAKLHTAVLTDDPISNLHICGFGPGGRLGTGDETTRFDYVCIQGGGLASRQVLSIALGQDHCVAICSSGEVFTWGNNKYGQLGYVLPEVSSKETPVQLTPRQVYGLVKKETMIGAAASSIHSVIYTATGLYTFGKNEGQLGLMDADARSLKIQDIPRRVGVSLLQAQIKSVSAIDRATTVLLENGDVIVFTHYGFTKLLFPLEESNIFLSQALPTRYSREANTICKITSGGNTIGALSSFGQVYTVDVPKPAESVPPSVSTTNPNKARNALPPPVRVWTLKKSHMTAVDVAVGQNGSIILCTQAGAVWKKEKRANIKSVHTKGSENNRLKDYKFVRVPHLTRAIAVRSNAFGAFTAVTKDLEVTREQIFVDKSTLLNDLFSLLPFRNYGGPVSVQEDENAAEPELRFWLPPKKEASPVLVQAAILRNKTVEDDFIHLSKRFEPLSDTQYDVWVTSNVTEVRIPVHSTLLKARSRVLRSCLAEFDRTYYFSIPDIMSIEYGQEGDVEVIFQAADFLTLLNFVFYVYAETLIDVWHHTSKALPLAPRYRQIRLELMKIASHLELPRLERAVRVMVDPISGVREDFELAYMDLDFYSNADVVVDLAAGTERSAHSLILSSRCPFFEGLFHGRTAGMWISSRRNTSGGTLEPTRVDLKHIDAEIFDMVLRHVYADTGEELFDHLTSKDLDEFIDTVIEVMSVANELMLERLVQICQSVIGKYVTPRNICGLLNAIAESSVDQFKDVALEYLCLNLEGMLEQRLLVDLDQYLLQDLDQVVQENQLAFMPFVRSQRAQHELFDRHTDLAEQVEASRQRRIDFMRFQTKYIEESTRPAPKIRIGSHEKLGSSPVSIRKIETQTADDSPQHVSPALTPNDISDDLPFDMDEDAAENVIRKSTRSSALHPSEKSQLATSARSDTEPTTGTIEIEETQPHLSRQSTESRPLLPETRVSGFELPKSAWKQYAEPESRADFKQIMEQASNSRVSNLTKAMTAAEPSRPHAQKMSQKERKRQQHQTKVQPEATADEAPAIAATPQSPWSRVAPVTRTNLKAVVTESTLASAPQTPQRPGMPTTQTIPPVPSAGKDNQSNEKRATAPANKIQITNTAAPQIQSIRHAPLPHRSSSFVDAHTSMADILAQQQGEKTAIREATAKRSLQDIQQEQEFQEWWDQESRRVQEEAAQASASVIPRVKKTGRDRSNRRRGSGRGGGTSSTNKDQEQKVQDRQAQTPPESHSQAPRKGSEGRGRGHSHSHRRGRGRARHENEPKPPE